MLNPAPQFAAPFVSSIMKVEPAWIDYNGHLNMAYYNVLFDRGADERPTRSQASVVSINRPVAAPSLAAPAPAEREEEKSPLDAPFYRKALAKRLNADGPLESDAIDALARILVEALPPA